MKDIMQRLPTENAFYRERYDQVLIGLIAVVGVAILITLVVLYQFYYRPNPEFHAQQANGQIMTLVPYPEPNLLPDTVIRWASKAAVLAYTFDFNDYKEQLNEARPYFSNAGWVDYKASVDNLINGIVAKQLIVNSVVSDVPVIANEGELPGKGYSWRVQIPLLVTYQANVRTVKTNYLVTLTIIKVPTNVNPQGINIDQFLMV